MTQRSVEHHLDLPAKTNKGFFLRYCLVAVTDGSVHSPDRLHGDGGGKEQKDGPQCPCPPVHVCLCPCPPVYVCLCPCPPVYVCLCPCPPVHVCLWNSAHTTSVLVTLLGLFSVLESERERERERETDRQTDRQTDRRADREIERDRQMDRQHSTAQQCIIVLFSCCSPLSLPSQACRGANVFGKAEQRGHSAVTTACATFCRKPYPHS